MLKYGMTNISPHHMNTILVETWYAFKVSTGNTARGSFVKRNIPPLITPNLTTKIQVFAAYLQVYSVSKA